MSYPPGPPNEGDSDPQNPYPAQGGDQPGHPPPPGAGQQPGYGQPGYPPPPGPGQQPGYGGGQPPSTNGKALASLITGISALVLSWCCGLGLAGLVAVFLGIKGRGDVKNSNGSQTGEGLALAGIITGAIAALIGLVSLGFLILAIASGNGEFEMYSNY